MKRGIEIGGNLAFWLLTAGVITASFSIQAQEFEIIDGAESLRIVRSERLVRQLLLVIGWAAVLFYANLWLLVRLGLTARRARLAWLSPALLLGAAGLYYGVQTGIAVPGELYLAPGLSGSLLVFYYSVSTAYGSAKIWLRTDRQRQALLLDKKRAELTLLRNQLHPHFLFNVLNNLLSMVDQRRDPQLATALDKLSGLLRYVVYDTGQEQVRVAGELDFIRNFAELQALRFAPGEVDFRLDVRGEYDAQAIEPGLFIPFVENAFKYGTEPEVASTIAVAFDLTRPDRIHFSISNPIRDLQRQSPTPGTGLRATRERLALVYPDRHELHISENHATFSVALTLDTDANRDH